MTEEAEHEMVMPFVTVTSKGGPHDDKSYCAGWEMGRLDALLAGADPFVTELHLPYMLAASIGQADLIAMRHGFTMTSAVDDGPTGSVEWRVATFTRKAEGT